MSNEFSSSKKMVHLVRHAEVVNPEKILYGRIPGFSISDKGFEMSKLSASTVENFLTENSRTASLLIVSPLLRARQSAKAFSDVLNLKPIMDVRVVEPYNAFEGCSSYDRNVLLKSPKNWGLISNPFKPSWGEPYSEVLDRMHEAMFEAYSISECDVVIVSHQMPIWMVSLNARKKNLWHNPAKRRCDLSSVTSFVFENNVWHEVSYISPAKPLLISSVDVGAV